MSPVPLLIISDSPASSTGLGRLTRELATRIHTRMPDVFRVATLGYHGQHSSRLPFPQYQIRSMGPGRELYDLPEVVNDFFQAEAGVVMACWNPGWLDWMAHPDSLEGEANEPLKQLLTSGKVKRWVYAPIDGDSPNGKLPESIIEILKGFDRTLAYCDWASKLIQNQTGVECPWVPHGIEGKVFFGRDRKLARDSFMPRIARLPQGPIPDDMVMVGVVGTNSRRKDWPLAFATCAELVKRGVNACLWAHTDSFYKEYDFLNLTTTYGLNNRVIPTSHYLSSDKLAWAYSAMDVTLGIGSGEGFGFPIFESMACGTPCLHGDYAGAAEFIPAEYKIRPTMFSVDGVYLIRRPVFDPSVWADRVIEVAGKPASLPTELSWESAWLRWQEWLLAGVK